MNRATNPLATSCLCFAAAFFVAFLPAGAAGDEQCGTAAVGVQPARRALKALGIVRGKRIHHGGALNAEASTIDPSIATGMNSKVELHVEFDAVANEAQQILLDNDEVWPAASALFPAEGDSSPAPDHPG